jgi:hypothetical protein
MWHVPCAGRPQPLFFRHARDVTTTAARADGTTAARSDQQHQRTVTQMNLPLSQTTAKHMCGRTHGMACAGDQPPLRGPGGGGGGGEARAVHCRRVRGRLASAWAPCHHGGTRCCLSAATPPQQPGPTTRTHTHTHTYIQTHTTTFTVLQAWRWHCRRHAPRVSRAQCALFKQLPLSRVSAGRGAAPRALTAQAAEARTSAAARLTEQQLGFNARARSVAEARWHVLPPTAPRARPRRESCCIARPACI